MALLGSEEPNVLFRTVMQRTDTTKIFLPCNFVRFAYISLLKERDELKTNYRGSRGHFQTMILFFFVGNLHLFDMAQVGRPGCYRLQNFPVT